MTIGYVSCIYNANSIKRDIINAEYTLISFIVFHVINGLRANLSAHRKYSGIATVQPNTLSTLMCVDFKLFFAPPASVEVSVLKPKR